MHHLVGKLSTAETLLTEVQHKVFLVINVFNQGKNLCSPRIIDPDMTQMSVWRMRITCWIPEATNTDSEYVILIAFPLQ